MPEVHEGAGELGLKLVARMAELTAANIQGPGLANARRNSPLFARGRSLKALRDESLGEGDSALVIAAGPSVKKQDPLAAVKATGYRGALVVADSAIAYCLRNGVIPDLAVSLDPDPHTRRILRWFGDPELTEAGLRADDYFRRQDLEPSFHDELRNNEEVLELLDRHGKEIRIALCTASCEPVVKRVHEIGMQVYWWNPILDDPGRPGSVTRALQRENRLPSVNGGGNVGSACWMMAHAVLAKRHVGLTGIDFSYYPDTPYVSTSYYKEAVELVGERNLDAIFMRIYNPYTESWFYTDPAYRWYREAFLEMVLDADCTTHNCTEGGILFGDGIEFVSLAAFLERFAP